MALRMSGRNFGVAVGPENHGGAKTGSKDTELGDCRHSIGERVLWEARGNECSSGHGNSYQVVQHFV